MMDSRQSLTDIAYQAIKNKIFDLTFPPGTILTESGLASMLQMSRSPISQAVRILEREGLLVNDYYKRIRVRQITRKDIIELYQIREILESLALLEIFKQNRTKEYSFRLEEKVVRMRANQDDPYGWEKADTEFHMELISVLNNDRITKIYLNNLEELIRIGLLSQKNNGHMQKINQNLLRMIEHIRNNEYEPAYAILKQDHLLLGKDMALKMVAE